MAANTDRSLQNQIIYSIYVRNHTAEGSFLSLVPDLDRIRALGADILWFLPIHPIGVKGKKGSLGCPYANRDYRAVNPEYGSMEDFKTLVREIHRRGMKVIIDVVYNHTSPDAVLLQEHPEFYYRGADGRFGNKIGAWSDVIDLDYGNRALWAYQIESLCRWAEIVDGFRCDVASFVPLEFWKEARSAVEKVRPSYLWLAETVHLRFGNQARACGLYAMRDTDAFEAFDIEYPYDIWDSFEKYLDNKLPLSACVDLLNMQEGLYPENYNKLRFLENHDQPRIRSRVEEACLDSYTALLYFLKGTTLIYAGQEFSCTRRPSLFEKDVIGRGGRDISPLLWRLAEIKRLFGPDDSFCAQALDEAGIAVMERGHSQNRFFGIFPLQGKSSAARVEASDGDYVNLIDGSAVSVRDKTVFCSGNPMIWKV